MCLRFVITIVVLSLCSVSNVNAQAKKKIMAPAELLPADSLYYFEVQKQGQLAKELRNLLKGTYLDNAPDSLKKLKGLEKLFGQAEQLQILGTLFSPEAAGELNRIQGVGASMISYTEFVLVLLPGKSNLPGLATRALLSGPDTKKVGVVEKVDIYQTKLFDSLVMGGGFAVPEPPPFEEKGIEKKNGNKESEKDFKCGKGEDIAESPDFDPHSPVIAMMPDVLVLGSFNTVKDVILRAKGKKNGPSLADSKLFQDVRKQVEVKPGVFYFSNDRLAMKETMKLFPEDMKKEMNKVYEKMGTAASLATVYSFSLEKGTLQFSFMNALDPKVKNPLLELYPDKGYNIELLRFADKNSSMVAGMANTDPEERFRKLIAFFDGLSNLAGPPQETGTEQVKKLEEQLKINLVKDVLSEITNVEFIIGDILNAPTKRVTIKGPNYSSTSTSPMVPMVLVVETKSEASAKSLFQLLPRIRQLPDYKDAKQSEKTVKGHKITGLALMKDYTLYYARSGKVLLLGPDDKAIADALIVEDKNIGLNTNKDIMARLQEKKKSFPLAVVKPMISAAVFGGLESTFSSKGFEGKEFPEKKQEGKEQEKERRKVEIILKKNDKQTKLFKKLMKQTAWTTIFMSREPELIRIDGDLPQARKLVAPLVDYALETTVSSALRPRVYKNGAKSEKDDFGEGKDTSPKFEKK